MHLQQAALPSPPRGGWSDKVRLSQRMQKAPEPPTQQHMRPASVQQDPTRPLLQPSAALGIGTCALAVGPLAHRIAFSLEGATVVAPEERLVAVPAVCLAPAGPQPRVGLAARRLRKHRQQNAQNAHGDGQTGVRPWNLGGPWLASYAAG